MGIEKTYISKATNISIFIVGTIFSILNNIRKYTSKEFPLWVHHITEQSFCHVKSQPNLQETILIISIIAVSFIMEIYIGIKIRNLPWRKLKTVTIG